MRLSKSMSQAHLGQSNLMEMIDLRGTRIVRASRSRIESQHVPKAREYSSYADQRNSLNAPTEHDKLLYAVGFGM